MHTKVSEILKGMFKLQDLYYNFFTKIIAVLSF